MPCNVGIQNTLDMELQRHDELFCLMCGLHYSMRTNPLLECYYFSNPDDSAKCAKRPYNLSNNPYPFLVVNIGSGVSILCVRGPNQYYRVSGTRLFYVFVTFICFGIDNWELGGFHWLPYCVCVHWMLSREAYWSGIVAELQQVSVAGSW